MKTCPFCREEIHDEAVKCRYCCSRLSGEPLEDRAAIAREKAGPGQVVYIVDRDLIRFAKFAAAVLGIFITVGVCIWGFDVTKAAKEVHESSDQARRIQTELNRTKEDIQLAKEKILAASGEINADQEKTRQLLAQRKNWSIRSPRKSNRRPYSSRGSSNAAERPASRAKAFRSPSSPGSTTFRRSSTAADKRSESSSWAADIASRISTPTSPI